MVSLALKLLADVIIALVAFYVIFSIFQTFVPATSGSGLCKFYQAILNLPLPSFLKPNIQQCSIQPTTETLTMTDTAHDAVAQDIETYIYNCWHDKASNGSSGITFLCYELYFSSIDSPVSEKDVTLVLSSKNLCSSLPNNFLDFERQDFNCGNANKIYWNAKGGTFNGTAVTVDIKYDAFVHQIDVS